MNQNLNPPIPKPKMISLENLFKESWQNYKDNFKKIFSISLLMFLPNIILQFLEIIKTKEIKSSWLILTQLELTPWSISIFILFIISILFSLWGSLSLAFLFKEKFQIKVKESYKKTSELILPYLLIVLMTYFLIFVGFLLFIIPGIYLTITLGFVLFALVMENYQGLKALVRSFNLVRGYFWPTFVRYLSLLFLFLLLFFPSVPLSFIPQLGFYLQIIYNLFITILIVPFSLLFSYYIFNSLREIKANL